MDNIKLHQSIHKECSRLLFLMEVSHDADYKQICAERYAELVQQLCEEAIEKTIKNGWPESNTIPIDDRSQLKPHEQTEQFYNDH